MLVAELELDTKSPGFSPLWLSILPHAEHRLFLAHEAYPGNCSPSVTWRRGVRGKGREDVRGGEQCFLCLFQEGFLVW